MGDDPRSDPELVAAVNRGDSDAFAVLYRRHRDRVLRLAWRWTGNEADALDVLQDAFRDLLGRFPGFRLTARLTTFLYPVVRNLARERRRRRTREGGDPGLEALAARAAAPGASGAAREVLVQVLQGLDPDHRETLLLRHLDGLSIEELAAVLGVPAGTVKSRLHHALARLRDGPGRFFFRDP